MQLHYILSMALTCFAMAYDIQYSFMEYYGILQKPQIRDDMLNSHSH